MRKMCKIPIEREFPIKSRRFGYLNYQIYCIRISSFYNSISIKHNKQNINCERTSINNKKKLIFYLQKEENIY